MKVGGPMLSQRITKSTKKKHKEGPEMPLGRTDFTHIIWGNYRTKRSTGKTSVDVFSAISWREILFTLQ